MSEQARTPSPAEREPSKESLEKTDGLICRGAAVDCASWCERCRRRIALALDDAKPSLAAVLEPETCWTCGGDGGSNCICDGTGMHANEVYNMRVELMRLRGELPTCVPKEHVCEGRDNLRVPWSRETCSVCSPLPEPSRERQ